MYRQYEELSFGTKQLLLLTPNLFLSFSAQVNAEQPALHVHCGRAKQWISTAVFAQLNETAQCTRTFSYLFVLFHITVDVSVRNLTQDSVFRPGEKGNKCFCKKWKSECLTQTETCFKLSFCRACLVEDYLNMVKSSEQFMQNTIKRKFVSVSAKTIYKLSTEMLPFSEKHESKHTKVPGKFSAAPTGATLLPVLQICKLKMAENMLQFQRATLLPGQCLSRWVFSTHKNCYSKAHYCSVCKNKTI